MEPIFKALENYKPTHTGFIGDKPGKIFEAIASVMAKVNGISKDHNNKDQGFKYRSIDDVYNMIQPILAECKVFARVRMIDCDEQHGQTANGKLKIRVIAMYVMDLITTDGSILEFGPIVGEAADTGDKVYSKTLSIADKYLMLTTFKIPTDDFKDPDGETPPETQGTVLPPKVAAKARGEAKSTPPPAKPQPQAQQQPQNPAPTATQGDAPMTPEQRGVLTSYWKSGRMKIAFGDETPKVLERLKTGVTFDEAEALIKTIDNATTANS